MENQRYMQEGLDMKRIFLLWKRKIWMAAAAVAAGALIGSGVYLFVHLAFVSEREFQTVSKLYLNFNCEPKDFNELSYNGYTWNDLMATDPILDYTMEALPAGMDKHMVIDATRAEILSDIRLLTITITANDPQLAAQIMEATQKSLVHLGETDELFDSIEVYSTAEPQQIVWDNRTVQAAVTGAVLGLLAVLLVQAFYYVLDDSVYLAGDVEKRYGIPVFGMFVAGGADKEQPYGKEFAVNYGYLCRNAKTAVLVSVDAQEDAETAERMIKEATGADTAEQAIKEAAVVSTAERVTEEAAGAAACVTGEMAGGKKNAGIRVERMKFPVLSAGGKMEADERLYRRIREAGGVVLAVRYGCGNGKCIERVLSNLKKQDCRILGVVIINADERFLKLYYLGKRKNKDKS